MPLHFAPSRAAGRSVVARILSRPAPVRAANDNGEFVVDDHLVEAALRHFAKHGLGAAREAREQAKIAFFNGDRKAYDWWLGVCRTLDRRVADRLEQNAR